LKESEPGVETEELCRIQGITRACFITGGKSGGLEVSENLCFAHAASERSVQLNHFTGVAAAERVWKRRSLSLYRVD